MLVSDPSLTTSLLAYSPALTQSWEGEKRPGTIEGGGREYAPRIRSAQPREDIERMFQECGVAGRQRKLNRRMLVRAMIISGGTPGGSYRADILRSSLEFAVAEVVHLGFYPLFDEPLDQSMVVLVQLAMNHAWARQVDLSDPLAGVTNQDIFDSVTVKVQEVLLTDFHLSESYIRVHKALSVPMPASTAPGPANPIAYG